MPTTASKVAEVTLVFWIIKICATTLGETAGDLLSMTLGIGYAASTLLLGAVFVVTVALQLRARRFHPALFWSVVLATSTAGTTLSDYMDRTLGLGYLNGSLILSAGLAVVLLTWRLNLGTLSVHHMQAGRAEVFYWTAILVSNTLGTALGDFLADDSGLGFLGSALLIGAAIALLAGGALYTRLSRVLLFWAAFVLTRPFGATFGDLLTKPVERGGLDFGTVGASAILTALLGALLLYTSLRHRNPGQN